MEQVYDDIFTGADAVIGCTLTSHDSSYFAQDLPCLSARYSGPATSATLEISGVNDSNGRTITVKVGNAVVGSFVLGKSEAYTTGTKGDDYHTRDVVHWLNSFPDWHAELLDDSRRASSLSLPGKAGATFAASDAKDADLTPVSMFDLHADFYQRLYGTGGESVVVWGCQATGFTGQNVLLNSSAPSARDYLIANNAFYNNPTTSDYAVNAAFFSQFGPGQHRYVMVQQLRKSGDSAARRPWLRA